MISAKVHAIDGGHRTPPLPEAIILVLAPFAPLFSHRVWLQAQLLLLGAMLAPGARTVTAALRVMGLAMERHCTNYHRVLNRATALCRPAEQVTRRRHKTRADWVRQMMPQVRRWLPGRKLVLVVDGGFAAVSLALACVKHQVVMVSRLRWDAALYRRPGPQPPGKRGPKPAKGRRQRSLQGWASRSDSPWEDVEVDWYGGQRQQLWVFSRTALWSTPGLPPVEIRFVLVCDPEGKLHLEACFCTDLEATPAQILA